MTQCKTKNDGKIEGIEQGVERGIEQGQNKKAIETASKSKDSSKVYVIGGENIYKEFLPIAHRMIITEVESLTIRS